MKSKIYTWVITRNGTDVGTADSVEEAFRQKQPSDRVLVELIATGLRAHVLRAG